MLKHIFFDIDGTLVDVSECFVNCVRHALGSVGKPLNEPRDLREFIGLPILGTFRTLLPDADEELRLLAIERYRERFATMGIREARTYPGVTDLLSQIAAHGVKCSIVTNRPQGLAQRTLQHLSLAKHFERIHGPEPTDHRSSKADLLGHALRAGQLRPENVVMIGDRADDIIAARAHGVPNIAVTWGFGTPALIRLITL